MAYLEYTTKLRQWLPELAPEQSEDFINQAWRDIREANEEWSFLYSTEQWLAPAGITLTGLTVTQWSETVGLTVSAVAALAGLNNPALTLRQIRFGTGGGPIYSIIGSDIQQLTDGAIASGTPTLDAPVSAPFTIDDVGKFIRVVGAGPSGTDLDTTILAFVDVDTVTLAANASTTILSGGTVDYGSTLTLDRQYAELSDNDIGAYVYRIYYSPLSTDFQRIDHLTDTTFGYSFGHVIRDSSVLDGLDPQRSSVGQPYYLFFKQFDSETGLPVYEMWPGPSSQIAYPVQFWRLGAEFVDDDDALPVQISEELLMTRAKMLVYEWGMVANSDPRRRQSYANALSYIRSRYSTEGRPGAPLGLLEKAKRRDKSVYAKSFFVRGGRGIDKNWPPLNSRFWQSHALPAM